MFLLLVGSFYSRAPMLLLLHPLPLHATKVRNAIPSAAASSGPMTVKLTAGSHVEPKWILWEIRKEDKNTSLDNACV